MINIVIHTVCALLLAGTVGVSYAASPTATGADGFTIAIGRPAQRVITLAPHLTELVFSVGAGDRLVGVVAYSDHPPEAKKLPRVGDAFRVDLERIVALEPDLVLAWQSGTPADAVKRLRDLQLPVLVTEVHSLADIADTLRAVGRLTGAVERGNERAAAFESRIRKLREAHADSRTLSVFYQATAQPLFTVGGRHVIDEIISLCGGRNVFGNLDKLAPRIGEEAVVAEDPQVIIAGAMADEKDVLERWQRWPQVRAMVGGHLYRLDADRIHRSTTRIADGAADLCRHLDAARESAE